MPTNELDLILKVKSDLDKNIKTAEKQLKGLEKTADKSTKNIEQNFKSLGLAIQGAMGSAVLKAGADLIKQSEKTQLSIEVLRTRNKELADTLENVGDLTFGLANKFDMVNSVNRALSFGIDLSNGRLEKLLNLATKTSVVMGTDVKSAFDDLITGVSRESKMILDNLGVVVNLGDVYKKYAETIGVTTSELTKQQRQTALLDEVNRQLEKSTAGVTDEMVKQGTIGTQAIKQLESIYTTAVNISAWAFVEFGRQLGEVAGWIQNNFKSTADLTKREMDEIIERANKLTGINDALARITKEQNLDKYIANIRAGNEAYKRQLEEQEKIEKNIAKLRIKRFKEQRKEEERERKRRIEEIRRDKGSEISAIIDFEKEIDGYEELNNAEKIKKEQEYIEQSRMLRQFDLENLKAYKMQKAKELDESEELDRRAEKLRQYYEEWLVAEKDFNDAVYELADRNAKQKTFIEKEELKARKKLKEEERKQSLEHYNLLHRFGSEYLDAIIKGQTDKIPEILANQAMMFGQELFWDGVKTLWMGNAKNALFPGLGTSATAVGISEMAIGSAMMTGGAIASNSMSAGDGGAKERTETQQKEQTINLNIETSLYGSQTQARREVTQLLEG